MMDAEDWEWVQVRVKWKSVLNNSFNPEEIFPLFQCELIKIGPRTGERDQRSESTSIRWENQKAADTPEFY